MPVDQIPMDARLAPPPAYRQAAAPASYAGNAAAQRYMTEQAARGYGQANYRPEANPAVPPQAAAMPNPFAAPPVYQQAMAESYAQAAYQPAAADPYAQGGYQQVAVDPAAPGYAMVVPAQFSSAAPVQSYAQPTPPVPSFQAPGYVAAPAYQTYAAPAQTYQTPVYQAPQYQAPAYQQPTYQAPAYQAPVYQAPTTQTYQYQTPAYPAYQAPVYGAAPAYAAQPYVVDAYQAPAPTRWARAQARRQQRNAAKAQTSAAKAQQRAQQDAVRRQQAAERAYAYSSAQPAYQQPAYPVQGYTQPVYPQPSYGTMQAPVAQPYYSQTPTYAPVYPQGYAPPAAAPYPDPGYNVPAPAAPFRGSSYSGSGDPEMDRINSEIASLSADAAPGVEGAIGYRYRDGEKGLGQLNEVSGRVAASTGLGPGRVELSVSPVYVDAGTPDAQGLSRFGTNPLRQAQGIAGGFPPQLAPAENQSDAGVAVRLGYETGNLTADAGTTPMGFNKTRFQGGVKWAPRLSRTASARVFVESRPVTDSVLSYAGTDDPLTGVTWGEVVRTGGGGGLSIDGGRGAGAYVDVNFYKYRGINVRDNYSYEANVGGYLAAWRHDTDQLTVGVNVNYQHYGNNQNFFSYGHGGYFSPQRYISIGVPIRYRSVNGPLSLDLTATPGFQTYHQSGEAVFPTSDPLQAALLRLRSGNNNVLARYGSINSSGIGLALQGVGWYRVAPGTSVGGEIRLNTFGAYNEAQAMLRVRQSLGGLQ